MEGENDSEDASSYYWCHFSISNIAMLSKRMKFNQKISIIRNQSFAIKLGFLILVLISITAILFAIQYHAHSSGSVYQISPEYRRSLKKVLISLSHKEKTIELQASIINRLPSYTEILILAPQNNRVALKNYISHNYANRKIKLISFDTKLLTKVGFYLIFPEKDKLVELESVENTIIPSGSTWAQDLFEVSLNQKGETQLLVLRMIRISEGKTA
jgi:hypothetical protein